MQQLSEYIAIALSVGSGIGSLLLFKGVIEPAAAYWGGRLTRRYLPDLFDLVEPFVPKAIQTNTIRNVILNGILRLEEEKGEKLTKTQEEFLINEFVTKYNVLIAAQKLEGLGNV